MSTYAYTSPSGSKHAQYYPSPPHTSGPLPHYTGTSYPTSPSQLPPIPPNWQPSTPWMAPVPLPTLPEDQQLAHYHTQLSACKGDPTAYKRAQRDIQHLEAQLAERANAQQAIIHDAHTRARIPEKSTTPAAETQRHYSASHSHRHAAHALPSPPPSPHRPHVPLRAYDQSSAARQAVLGGSVYPGYSSSSSRQR
ncbi:hypothetical protein CERSUDRAFT_114970 [Gelatoporia subvermispora B]|uniref:Uncharacterized protein n=1 Tax=Ceriporiopsis subvermispora (strain B) TaxID=914234 RepID=M2PL84_CERS8|nr:hypothetical protein CERSUDRAFT_114970 [Gelatoporia subvermispora B]